MRLHDDENVKNGVAVNSKRWLESLAILTMTAEICRSEHSFVLEIFHAGSILNSV